MLMFIIIVPLFIRNLIVNYKTNISNLPCSLALKNYPKNLAPHTTNFIEFFKKAISCEKNKEILSVCEGTYSLLQMVKLTASSEDFCKLYAEFLMLIQSRLEKTVLDSEAFLAMVEEVKPLYTLTENALKPEEVKTLFESYKRVMSQLSDAIKNNEEGMDADTEDNDEDTVKEILQQDAENYEASQTSTMENLGELLKHNLNAFKENLAEDLINFYLSNVWNPTISSGNENPSLSALYAICDIFEFIYPDHPTVKMYLTSILLPILDAGSKTEQFDRYQLVSYAVGVFAKNAKKETFEAVQNGLLELLANVAKKFQNIMESIKKGNNFGGKRPAKRQIKLILDNIGAAYGKMLKYQKEMASQEQILKLWLQYIPIQADKAEMPEQHELFADLILDSKFEAYYKDDSSKKLLLTQKITAVREKSEKISDQGVRRKIEHAYLTLTKN